MHSTKYMTLCRYISVLLYIACVVYPCWVAYFWYQAPGVVFSPAQDYGLRLSLLPASMLHPQQLTSMVKCLGFMISWIPGAVVVYICYAAANIFHNLAQQRIFSLLHVKYLRNMAYALFIGQLLHPVYDLLLSGVLSWHTEHPVVSVSFTVTNIVLLVCGILLMIVAQVFLAAQSIQAEQDLTI